MKVPKITMTTPYPDPVDQRVDEELDDGPLVVRIGAFEDDVKIVLKGRMDRDDGGRLGVVGVDEVDAALWREASDQLAVVVDVEQGKLRIIVGVGVFGVALADDL